MDQSWDALCKLLVRADPAAILTLIDPHLIFLRIVPDVLNRYYQDVDMLLEAMTDAGERLLIDVEFQTYNDTSMAKRLVRYNILIRSENEDKLDVLSVVIYLLKDGTVPSSPLILTVPRRAERLSFDFVSIELAKRTPEQIRGIGQVGLLPLLPLTQGGATRTVVQGMLEDLQQAGNDELMAIGYTFVSLLWRNKETNMQWLRRRYGKMQELINESFFLQDVLKQGRDKGLDEGLKKGREEGRDEGRDEGRVLALQQAVLSLIQTRFPQIHAWAQEQIARIEQPDVLADLIPKIVLAPNAEEAQQHLLAALPPGPPSKPARRRKRSGHA